MAERAADTFRVDPISDIVRAVTSPQPTSTPYAAVRRRPLALEVAVGLVVLAALVNTYIGVLVAVQAPAAPSPVSAPLVVLVVAICVLYAAALVVFVLLLRAGRTGARAVLVSVSTLALLTLFALNALNLLVIVLLLAADVLLYRRSVSTWIRRVRGLSPA